MQKISEKKFVIVLALIAFLWNLAPDLYRATHPVEDVTYVGLPTISMDFSFYLTEMRAGFEGKWLSVDPFTTEEHSPLFYHPFYLSLGHLSRIAGLSIEKTFHIARYAFGLLFMAASIYCTRSLVRSLRVRRYAYLLTFFAGGIGYIVPFAVRVWPGTTSLLRFADFPHFMLAHSLFVFAATLCFLYGRETRCLRMAVAGMCVALLNIVLPYYSILLIALAGVLVVERMLSLPSERKKIALHAFLFLAISLPSFIVMALIGLSDHPLAISQHGVLRAYSIPELLTGFGGLWIFFIIGFRSLQRHDDGRASACTLACGMLLMYSLPIAQKTRLFEATTILPVAIGASYGMSLFFEVLTRWRNRSGSLMRDTVLVSAITLVVVGIFAGPAVASWKRFLVRYHSDATRVSSPFLPNGNIEAMRWLSVHTKNESIILSSMVNGNVIPYFSNRRVFIGHWLLTLDLDRKRKQAYAIFEGRDSQNTMHEFLKKEKISYVFYSFYEKIPGDFSPENYSFLKNVYQNREVTLYQVL
ncbi:MAG: hypothetical protein AAB416_02325 [Patescibacteria group bacterium]